MSVKINPVSVIEKDLGLEPYGDAHRYFAETCMSRMEKYVPFKTGALSKVDYSKIDNECNIHYDQVYARYQYYGKLMVMDNGKGAFYNPKTKRFWSKKGEKKSLTEIDLHYNTTYHPYAGAHWDRLMLSAEEKDLEQEMQDYIKKRGRK